MSVLVLSVCLVCLFQCIRTCELIHRVSIELLEDRSLTCINPWDGVSDVCVTYALSLQLNLVVVLSTFDVLPYYLKRQSMT